MEHSIPLVTDQAQGYQTMILQLLTHRRQVLDAAIGQLQTCTPRLTCVAEQIITTLRLGHKLLVAGNGGSAAEAQHFVAEIVGRFKYERAPYPALALTADSAILSAIGNDYGYAQVFARQIRAYGQPGDIFIAFSTSGKSENLIQAATMGRDRGVMVIAITGGRSSRLEHVADVTVQVPVVDTAITQELHMVITHVLCEIVESQLVEMEASGDASNQADEENKVGQNAQSDFS